MPINIRSDGAFQFLVRVGTRPVPRADQPREGIPNGLLEPYLYLSDGTACLSGIEYIGADLGPTMTTLAVPAGPCAVTIHLIEWDAEPGAKDARGDPAPGALPDYAVLISPGGATANPYRIQLQTFDRD